MGSFKSFSRLALLFVALVFVAPASAFAATRYATAASTTTSGPCATVASACELYDAVESANSGDQVIVEAGTYANQAFNIPAGVAVTGDPAQALPVVSGSNGGGTLISMDEAGASLSRMIVNELSTGYAVSADANDLTLDGIQATGASTGQGLVSVVGANDRVVDSVIDSSNLSALFLSGDGGQAVNDTAVSTNGIGVVFGNYVGSATATLQNVIARGASRDLVSSAVGSSTSTLNVSYSNYKTTNTSGTATIVDQGHNQTAVDPFPIFVDQATGNLHEAARADTIDHGIANGLAGGSDADGNPRVIGAGPDIGAYEHEPAPTVSTSPATSVARTAVTLVGSVNPNGTPTTAHFELGTAPGAYTQTISAGSPGSGTAPVVVSAPATGLAPNTTYYYRLDATNTVGPGLGNEQSFHTVPLAPLAAIGTPATGARYLQGQTVRAVYHCDAQAGVAACRGPVAAGAAIDTRTAGRHTFTVTVTDDAGQSATASASYTVVAVPTVTHVSQSHRRWRERGRPPVGTRFTLALNDGARLTFAFTQPATGRKVGSHCVALTHSNRHRRSCTLTVTRGSVSVSARAGRVTFAFTGTLAAHHRLAAGTYTVLITASTAGHSSRPARLRFTILG